MARIERDGTAAAGDRLLRPAPLVQQGAEVGPGVGKGRPDRDGAANQPFRRVEIAPTAADQAEPVQRGRIARPEPENLAIERRSLRELAGRFMGGGQGEEAGQPLRDRCRGLGSGGPAGQRPRAARSRSAAASSWMTGRQLPGSVWRNSRAVGYHGVSGRCISQR